MKNELLNEITLLSQLDYPLLLKFYGITNIPPFCIITEYLPHDLQSYIKLANKGQADNNWNITTKMFIIIGIALGMRYLHKNNISHRDLKPQNVLLDSNLYPRICDFGLSKAQTSSMSSNVGTPQFCAPEVASASEDMKYNGEKADVYSYAMTIYSILYDVIPFEGIHLLKLIQEVVLNGKRPELDGQISEKIDNLIRKCWDPNPNNRPNFTRIVDELKNPSLIEEIADIDIEKINDLLSFCKESIIEIKKEKDQKEKKNEKKNASTKI